MLERIALHQTRLRTPGLGLDGKGVALGAKGLVLLPSIDRLVAWLSVYTRERSLEDLLGSIELRLVRSKLGTREITLEFAAESSDRMDRIAETSRLVGGFAFTGTSRHFVQYRDAAAPFGYDAAELISTDSALALYHDKFTQVYDTERAIELRALLLRLMPHVDPSTGDETGPRFVVAERGLGPALIHYFVRSKVEAEVGVVEWPPESAFDESAVQRYLFRVPDLPLRMRPLLYNTPGLTTFMPAGPGIAVEVGHRHPVSLRAVPIFPATGLVLIRGGGKEPWNVTELPAMGDIRAFARVELRQQGEVERAITGSGTVATVRVPLRVVPSTAPWRNIVASWLTPEEIPMLRKLAYALPTRTIANTRIAITSRGAFLKCPTGIEGIPLGTLFYEIHPQLFIPAGFDVTPAIAPDVLYRALGASSEFSLFVTPDARSISVEERGFSPFENSIIEAKPFEPLMSDAVERALTIEPITLQVESLGLLPLRGVAPPDADGTDVKALPSGDSEPLTPHELGEVVERLFKTFTVPLVLGGPMSPGRPIGGRTALLIEDRRMPSDTEAFSHVHLARIRRARELAPVDRFDAFSQAEWTLLAALHDLAQATHPDLAGFFRSKTPGRLIQVVSLTLDRVAPPATAKEALSRHSLFARLFDIRRVTTEVSWWTGKAKFVGTKPPSRLTAWPEFRRVNIHEVPEPFAALPVGKAQGDFQQAIAKFLTRTPLTDLATCERPEPAFVFGPENIALISTHAGQTLALRALAHGEAVAVDGALGKAARALVAARAFRPLFSVLTLLGERALARAQEELLKSPDPKPLAVGEANDANFARAVGALRARTFIAEHGECFREHERKSMLAILEARAMSPAAREFEALLG